MPYVVDTNVVSELVKKTPNAALLEWLSANDRDLYLTAITIEEMRLCTLMLPNGKRRHVKDFEYLGIGILDPVGVS